MKMKVHDYDEMLKEALKDPEFRKEYDALEEEFEIAKQVIDLRLRKGLLLSHTVVDIQGLERLSGVTVARVGEDRLPIPGTERQFDCDTLLLSVGLIPENELSLSAGVRLSPITQGPAVNNQLETNIKGIFACGNVLHVHDLVDDVSQESMQAGQAAARFLRGEKAPFLRSQVKDGQGVRGTVPQRLDVPQENVTEPVTFMFRPDTVYQNHFVTIRTDSQVLLSQKRLILTPGEMAQAKLTPQQLEQARGQTVTIEITKEKQN